MLLYLSFLFSIDLNIKAFTSRTLISSFFTSVFPLNHTLRFKARVLNKSYTKYLFLQFSLSYIQVLNPSPFSFTHNHASSQQRHRLHPLHLSPLASNHRLRPLSRRKRPLSLPLHPNLHHPRPPTVAVQNMVLLTFHDERAGSRGGRVCWTSDDAF